MSVILTHNQIVKLFELIANNHYNINGFFCGKNSDLQKVDNEVLFPLLQIKYDSFSLTNQSAFDNRYDDLMLYYTVRILDVIDKGEDNKKDIYSDCTQIAQDIINLITTHQYFVDNEIVVRGDVIGRTEEYTTTEKTAGVRLSFAIRVRNNASYCGLPMSDWDSITFPALTDGNIYYTDTNGDVTRVQPGLNTYTGGTDNYPTVNITGASLNNIYVSGSSQIITLSSTTYYSAATNLESVIATHSRESLGELTYEPTGFPNRTDSTLTYDPSSNSFNVSGTNGFDYYWRGQKRSRTSDSCSILNTTNSHYIYYDINGTLSATTTYQTDFSDHVPVALLIKNVALNDYFLIDERHGVTMDWVTHQDLHNNVGAYRISDFGLSGWTLAPTVPTTANNTFSVDAGQIADEDIFFTTTQLPEDTCYTWLYLSANTWMWQTGTTPYKYTSGGYINYNHTTGGGGWSQTITARYINYYVCAVAELKNSYKQIVTLPCNIPFGTLAAADAASFSTNYLTGFPFLEIVPLWKVIYKTNSSYTSNGKCRIEKITRINRENIAVVNTSTQIHNSLSGLQGGQSGEYYHLTQEELADVAFTSSANTFTDINYFSSLSATTLQTNIDDKRVVYSNNNNLQGSSAFTFDYTTEVAKVRRLDIIKNDATESFRIWDANRVESVFIGVNAGLNNNSDYQVAIGSSAGIYANGNNLVNIGYNSGQSFTGTNSTNIGGSAGERGGGSDVVNIGYGTGYFSKGNYNVAIGSSTAYNMDGSYGTIIGTNAGLYMTGTNVVVIGYAAAYSATTATNSVFIGYQSGFNNCGINNIMLGIQTGYKNQNSNHIFIGTQAGYENTIGSTNIFIGASSGYRNTEGSNNTFLGYASGQENTVGNYNTYYGYFAGFSNKSSSGNVCLGYNAGYYNTRGNSLYIANSDTTAPLIYGEFDNNILKINGDLIITGNTCGYGSISGETIETVIYLTYSGTAGTATSEKGVVMGAMGDWTCTTYSAVYFLDDKDGDLTITIPDASASNEGRYMTFVKPRLVQSSNHITIRTESGQYITEVTAFLLRNPNDKATLVSVPYSANGSLVWKYRASMIDRSIHEVIEVSQGGTQLFSDIKSAVDYCNSYADGPRRIKVNPGTYYISATTTINCSSPITIEGFGTETTSVIATSALSGNPMFDVQTACDFKGFKLSGTSGYALIDDECAIDCSTSGLYFEVHNIVIDGFYKGIELDGSSEAWIFDSIINNCVSGVWANNAKVGISELTFSGNSEAIYFSAATTDDYMSIQNTIFNIGTGQLGINYKDNSIKPQYNFATSNAFYGAGTYISGLTFTSKTQSDIRYENNVGLMNYRPEAWIWVSGNSNSTTIATQGTYSASTFSTGSIQEYNFIKFSGTGDSAAFVYLPSIQRKLQVNISGDMSVAATNQTLSIALYKNETKLQDLDVRTATSGQPYPFALVTIVNAAENDIFSVRISNLAATNAPTLRTLFFAINTI